MTFVPSSKTAYQPLGMANRTKSPALEKRQGRGTQVQNLNSEWTYGSSIGTWSGDDFVECKRAGHPPGGLSAGIAVDPSGNIGLVFSGRLGGGFARSKGGAAGGSLTFSPSPTIFGLANTSPLGSVSGGGAGMGGSLGITPTGSVTITAGAATGRFGTFGGVGGTTVVPLVCVKP